MSWSMTLLAFGAVAVMAIAIPVIVYLVIVRRAREVQLLTTHGVARQARVTRKVYRTKPGFFRGITYEFSDAGGRTYRKFIAMVSTDDTRYTEGGMVDICYLQNDPGISSLKEIVDRTRELHSKAPR